MSKQCNAITALVIVSLLLTACAALEYNPYRAMFTPIPEPTGTAVTSFQAEIKLTPTPAVLCTVIVAESLNFRSGPGTSYQVIGWLYPGDVLEVTQHLGGWDFVRTQDGRTGWVYQIYCK